MHKSLQNWPTIHINYALQLLDHSFPDMRFMFALLKKMFLMKVSIFKFLESVSLQSSV